MKNFKEYILWNEAINSVNALTTPEKLQKISNKNIRNLSPEETRVLLKWYGIWEKYKNSSSNEQKEKLRIKRQNRGSKDPSPEEVLNRVHSQLMKKGRRGNKWIKH